MSDPLKVRGIILKVKPVLDYDRRLEILTFEKGRIAAFARGARRPRSKLVGTTDQFVFGDFWLREGRDAWQLVEVEAKEYFEPIRKELELIYAGMALCSIGAAFSAENADNEELAKALFVSLRALEKKTDPALVRTVFILKAILAEGFGIRGEADERFSEGANAALKHIRTASPAALFAFQASDALKTELAGIAEENLKRTAGHLSAQDILEELSGPK